jgi:hypothetical protein
MASAMGKGKSAPSPPSPLPPARERGAGGGVRDLFPTAHAMSCDLTPLTGLRRGGPHAPGFINELPTQDANRNETSSGGPPRGQSRKLNACQHVDRVSGWECPNSK